MFTLEHQDETIEYEKVNGGFAVKDSKLYISLETKSSDPDAFPDCFLFAVEGYPAPSGLNGLEINIETNPNDEPPNVFVYTTFHACEVIAQLKVTVVSDYEISVDFNIVSEDVNYYNEKARPNPFTGMVSLARKDMRQLWLPV